MRPAELNLLTDRMPSMKDAETKKHRDELQVTQKELEGKISSLIVSHQEKISAQERMHQNEVSMLQSQLRSCQEELDDRRRSADASRQKTEDLQANIMLLRATYEKDLASVRVTIEAELQMRMQRAVGSIDEKLQEAKKAREQLECELAKHIDTTATLLDQIAQKEGDNAQQRQTHRENIAELESRLQKHKEQEDTVRQECKSLESKIQAQLRQIQHMDGVANRMKAKYEQQLEVTDTSD